MLLATTIMLLVFRSPSATISVMWLISAKLFINEKPPFRLRKFHSIANLCATLNAATTFIMFIIYGTKFRSEFTRIYCCILNKIQKQKQTSTTGQEQQQQMKQFLSNNDKNGNDQYIDDTKMKINLLSTNNCNGHFCGELSKDNSDVGIATTASLAFLPTERLINEQRKQRLSYDEEHELMMNHHKNTHISSRTHQLTIPEDECIDNNHHDTKPVSLTGSYFDWFKNFFGYHQ
jgi:hypothetical protein